MLNKENLVLDFQIQIRNLMTIILSMWCRVRICRKSVKESGIIVWKNTSQNLIKLGKKKEIVILKKNRK